MTRQEHIHGVTCVIKSVGTFVDKDYIRIGLKNLFHGAKRTPMSHRHCLWLETFEELGVLNLAFGLNAAHPCRIHGQFHAIESGENGVERTFYIAYYWSGYRTVAIDLLGVYFKLNEPALGIPLTLTARQQPVKARSYKHDHIGLRHDGTAGGDSAQRVIVGHQTFGHRHGIERDTRAFNQLLYLVIDLRISGSLAKEYRRALCGRQHLHGTVHRLCRGHHCRTRIDRFEKQFVGIGLIHYGSETRSGNIKIHAAGPPGYGRAVSACHSRGYVLGLVHTVSGFYKAFGHIELVEAFVSALVEIDRLTHTRTGNLYHRITVDRGVGGGRKSVHESER